MVKRIQFGGDEVVKAKDGAGSATLSMAFAGARFVNSLLEACVGGKKGVKECTYVSCDVVPGLEFFSSVVELGPNGVEKVHPVPTMTAFEQGLFDVAVADLKTGIAKGIDFVKAATKA